MNYLQDGTLLCIVIQVNCQKKIEILEPNREIFFEKLTNLKVYEFIVPLVYKVPLKNSMMLIKEVNELIDLTDELSGKTKSSFKNILTQLFDLRNNLINDFSQNIQSKRNKRSVIGAVNSIRDFFGDTLVACCRVLTYQDGHKIVQNQDSLASHYEELRSALTADHQSLFQVNDIVSKMNQNLEKESKKMRDKMNEIADVMQNSAVQSDLKKL